MNKLPFVICCLGLATANLQAQTVRPVLTGAPFLRVSPDARAGGMGDQGVATSPDGFSQFWNASKYVFGGSYSGVGVSYTPYLSNLTNDVFLLNGTFYTFLGEEESSTIAASIYYFNLGEIQLTDIVGNNIVNNGIAKPNEFAVDFSYGLKLADTYSMSVTAKYIRSDLFNNVGNTANSQTKAANTFAVDVAGYFQTERGDSFLRDYEGRIRAGWGLFNMGPKLDYSNNQETSSYLPTTLRLGGGYDLYFDDSNRLSINLELAKLLVPTPQPVYDTNGELTGYETPDKSFISGMFSSFGDAPDGFSEELKEVTYSLGAEYSFNDTFSFRAGYFHESPMKGARQYATLGAGLKYQSFGIDVSYLITTSKTNSALDNTLRFGLTWDFGGATSQNEFGY